MLKLSNYELIDAGSNSYIVQLDVSNLNIKSIDTIFLTDGSTQLTTNTEVDLRTMYTTINSVSDFLYNLTNDILHLQVPAIINRDSAQFGISYYRYPSVITSLNDSIDIPKKYLGILTDYIIAETAKFQGKLVPEQVMNNINNFEETNND